MNYCLEPFQTLFLGPDGIVLPCCFRPVVGGKLGEVDLENSWNSKEFQNLRNSVIDGSYSLCRKNCYMIKQSPQYNGLSAEMKNIVDDKIIYIPISGIKHLTVGFDQRCNLYCASCRTSYIVPTEDQLSQYLRLIRELDKLAPNVEILDITGGDPFASPLMVQYMRSIKREEYKSLHSVYIATNGVLLDEDMWRSISHLHPFLKSLKISVDAFTEETYLKNRRGGNFKKLMSNLWFISGQIKQLPTCGVTLNFIPMKSNYRELPDFCRMAESMGFNVFLNQFENWGTYSAEEYVAEAVHEKKHINYNDFLNICINVKKQFPNVLMMGTMDI